MNVMGEDRGRGASGEKGMHRGRGSHTMLPAWSRKGMPLVFIILSNVLLIPVLRKSEGRGQGADMSLRTT